MGSNDHARNRVETGRTTPPAGHDKTDGDTHALRAGKQGTSQRKRAVAKEAPTRDAGRDDRRSGSESGRH